MTRKNFTNAIKTYLDDSTVISGVNLYSLSTRTMYMLIFNDATVSRSNLEDKSIELIEVIEDIAACYIVVDDIHPVEAVYLAHQRIVKADVDTSNIKKIIDMAKKSALVDAFKDSATDDIPDTLAYKQHLSILESVHVCLNIKD